MKFTPTPLKDAVIVDLERRGDERGFFARQFCKKEFKDAGLHSDFVQLNTSLSAEKGTLRGMHYQLPPSAEVKLVRCLHGAIWDAIIDLRPESPTYLKSYGLELNDDNRRMLYVPRGFGHGILTLKENTEILYMVSDFYAPECERGIRWNDPRFAIEWPIEPAVVSEKDQDWPDFDPGFHGVDKFRDLA